MLIDGVPLSELDVRWWRRQVGVVMQVTQRPYIFRFMRSQQCNGSAKKLCLSLWEALFTLPVQCSRQDPGLLSGTVADIIRYGKQDATLDEVKAAAEVAQAHEFIEALPNGYDQVTCDKITFKLVVTISY